MELREEIQEIANQLSELSLIDLKDIPRIDLYMEQVTKFFEDEMGGMRRSKNEKILTKTMINNYTKSGILDPPRNKKYNRDHIIALSYIFMLKPVLAIQDIHDLFEFLPKSHDSQQSAALYTVFCRMADEFFGSSAERIASRLEQADEMLAEAGLDDPRYAVLMLSLFLSIEASTHKHMVGRILDHFRGRKWEEPAPEAPQTPAP